MDRRRKRRQTQMRIIIGAILLAALVLGIVLVGFHIRSCDVIGNTRHSADEIRSDLIHDFATKNSLYFSWKYRIPGEEPRTPYLNSVQAKMTSPGAVQIIVEEKKIVGGTTYGGSNVYFDETGMVLEITDTHYTDVPLILGVSMDEPTLYQKIPVPNAALLSTMLKVCELMGQSGLVADQISFDENLNMTVTVADIEIELGQDEYLSEKISNLVTIYPKIAGQKGTLKLSSYTGRSDDIQFEEAQPEPETSDETWQNFTQEEGSDGTGTDGAGAEGTGADNAEADAGTGAEGTDQGTAEPEPAPQEAEQENAGTGEVVGVAGFMVFDSSGTLRYDARVINGQVVDAYGNPISGCSVNEDGNVVDAYWNVIDPMTGTLAQ